MHRRRKVLNIGGAKVQNIGPGGGGAVGKRFAGCKLIGEPPPPISATSNSDSIAKLRIVLKSILLEIPSNKIKGTYIKLVHLCSSFYCFTWALKESVGELLGGRRVCCLPPPKLLGGGGGGGLAPGPPAPSSYAYVV